MPESQGRNAVRIRDVRKVYGFGDKPLVALDTVSVAIRENEFFTLLGPSGCGKTTLLRLIAGFDYPTSGQILLHEDDIASLPPFRRPVNTVFQSYALFPHMTVAENIGFGLRMLGKPKEEIAARVAEMLRLVRMDHLGDRHVSHISGGQQQRVALARALAPQPKVLLLDEPLSALDYKLRKDMQFELKRLKDETGITFIFVTHDQEEALTMSDRIAVMSAGRILQVGSPRDIYDRPAERFVAGFIGESNFLISQIRHIANGRAKVDLASGGGISVAVPEGCSQGDRLTIVVRPEHARLAPADDMAMLRGVVEATVYLGTDTHFRVRLDDDTVFTVRQQNGGAVDLPSRGERTGIAFDAGLAQPLRD